jgi:cysteine-rich repeat protein
VRAVVEGCDDGNGVLTDACPDGPFGSCQAAFCGDGFRRAGLEACDDGNSAPGDGCSAACAVEGTCGNGLVEGGEACDDGPANDDTADGACRTDCTDARCGDFVVDYSLGERCDDGNAAAGDGCGATCQVEASPSCGDGTVDLALGEQCDDGGTAAGDGCGPACQFETLGASCGDATVAPPEVCDDGGTANGDACNPTCNLTNTTSLFAGQVGVPGALDGTGAAAQFSGTASLASYGGALWVADGGNRVIRRVGIPDAVVTTIAGTGTAGWLDDPVGVNAQFRELGAITTDGATLWIADQGNHVIRAIDLTDPSFPVTTVAGQVGVQGAADGIGAAATFDDLRGLTYYGGHVYLVDACRATLRRFNPVSGSVVTLAGMALPATCAGGTTVDGYGAAGRFVSPRYMASDNSGTLYIADTNGNLIRSYNVLTGWLGTFVGSGSCGYTDGLGAAAEIHRPRGMTSDGTSIYWVEFNAHTIRQAELATADVSTAVGTPPACALTCSCVTPPPGAYVEGVGAAARLDNPWSLTFNYPSASLFVFDGGNAVIRRIQ